MLGLKLTNKVIFKVQYRFSCETNLRFIWIGTKETMMQNSVLWGYTINGLGYQ